jgi:hypothetical protein
MGALQEQIRVVYEAKRSRKHVKHSTRAAEDKTSKHSGRLRNISTTSRGDDVHAATVQQHASGGVGSQPLSLSRSTTPTSSPTRSRVLMPIQTQGIGNPLTNGGYASAGSSLPPTPPAMPDTPSLRSTSLASPNVVRVDGHGHGGSGSIRSPQATIPPSPASSRVLVAARERSASGASGSEYTTTSLSAASSLSKDLAPLHPPPRQESQSHYR